ncbi:MAG: hypothetical protein WB770_04040 [Acidimicrobiales bacterium]
MAKFHGMATYQSVSRYRSFQVYETTLFVACWPWRSAGLSLWWMRRRVT